MTRMQLAWLAGWLEGEGTFYFTERTTSPKIAIQSFSTDRDVIEKAAKIARARVYSIKPRIEKTWNRLDGWRFSLECEPAANLMRKILPFMASRRAVQIRKALHGWAHRSNKPVTKRCACGCGTSFVAGPRKIYLNTTHVMRGWRKGQRIYRPRIK